MTKKLSILFSFTRNCNYVPILTYLMLVLLSTSVLVHVKSMHRYMSRASSESSMSGDDDTIQVSNDEVECSRWLLNFIDRSSATFRVYLWAVMVWTLLFPEHFARCVVRGSIQSSLRIMLFVWSSRGWIVQPCSFSVEAMENTMMFRSR